MNESCPKCKTAGVIKMRWQVFSTGIPHIRAYCDLCETWIQWHKRTPEAMAAADEGTLEANARKANARTEKLRRDSAPRPWT
jgi:hypothetical protein